MRGHWLDGSESDRQKPCLQAFVGQYFASRFSQGVVVVNHQDGVTNSSILFCLPSAVCNPRPAEAATTM